MKRRGDVFDEVRGKILDDLGPVTPLTPPWRRALAFLPWLLVYVGVMVPIIRPDYLEVPKLLFWGGSAAFSVIAYLFFVAFLREAVPGSGISWKFLAIGLGATLVLRALLAAAFDAEAPSPTPELGVWKMVVACGGSISLLGIPLAATGWMLAARGYLLRPLYAGLLLGVAAIIAAESMWRLHCPYTSPEHLVIAHWPAFLALAPLSGLVLERIAHRRRSRGEGQ